MNSWVCIHCYFENPSQTTTCSMCLRPQVDNDTASLKSLKSKPISDDKLTAIRTLIERNQSQPTANTASSTQRLIHKINPVHDTAPLPKIFSSFTTNDISKLFPIENQDVSNETYLFQPNEPLINVISYTLEELDLDVHLAEHINRSIQRVLKTTFLTASGWLEKFTPHMMDKLMSITSISPEFISKFHDVCVATICPREEQIPLSNPESQSPEIDDQSRLSIALMAEEKVNLTLQYQSTLLSHISKLASLSTHRVLTTLQNRQISTNIIRQSHIKNILRQIFESNMANLSSTEADFNHNASSNQLSSHFSFLNLRQLSFIELARIFKLSFQSSKISNLRSWINDTSLRAFRLVAANILLSFVLVRTALSEATPTHTDSVDLRFSFVISFRKTFLDWIFQVTSFFVTRESSIEAKIRFQLSHPNDSAAQSNSFEDIDLAVISNVLSTVIAEINNMISRSPANLDDLCLKNLPLHPSRPPPHGKTSKARQTTKISLEEDKKIKCNSVKDVCNYLTTWSKAQSFFVKDMVTVSTKTHASKPIHTSVHKETLLNLDSKVADSDLSFESFLGEDTMSISSQNDLVSERNVETGCSNDMIFHPDQSVHDGEPNEKTQIVDHMRDENLPLESYLFIISNISSRFKLNRNFPLRNQLIRLSENTAIFSQISDSFLQTAPKLNIEDIFLCLNEQNTAMFLQNIHLERTKLCQPQVEGIYGTHSEFLRWVWYDTHIAVTAKVENTNNEMTEHTIKYEHPLMYHGFRVDVHRETHTFGSLGRGIEFFANACDAAQKTALSSQSVVLAAISISSTAPGMPGSLPPSKPGKEGVAINSTVDSTDRRHLISAATALKIAIFNDHQAIPFAILKYRK